MAEVIEMPKYMYYQCPCGKCWNSDGTPVRDYCKDDMVSNNIDTK